MISWYVVSVDVKNAGDCTLEISICGPSGQNVSNNVVAQSPGLFLVSFAPVESGQHRASVTFNKENVRGGNFYLSLRHLFTS